MSGRIPILSLLAALLVVGPAAVGQEEPLKPNEETRPLERSREESLEEMRELREALKRLEAEAARIRRKMADLERMLPEGVERWEPLRRPRLFPFPDPSFDFHFRGLEDTLREFSRHLRGLEDLRRLGGRGVSIAFRKDADGSVHVTVRRVDEDGREKVETYEAESVEAFKKNYADVMKRYGISFDEEGNFSLRQPGTFERLLPRLFGGDGRLRPFGDDFEHPLMPQRKRLGVIVTPAGDDREGLRVIEVMSGTLAERLGIQPGDVIVRVNDQPIARPGDVAEGLEHTPPGSKVRVIVERKDKGQVTLEADMIPPRKRKAI